MLVAVVAHLLVLAPIFILKQTPPEAPEVFSAMLLPMAPPAPQAPAPAPKPEPVVKKSVPKPTPLPKPAPTDSKTAISQQQPVATPATTSEVQSTTPPAGADKPAPAAVVPPSFNAAYLNNPPPAYPAASKRYGEQGIVMLDVYVLADGTAGKVSVQKSSGFPRLDNAALEAVKQWKFVPAKRLGETVAAPVTVPVRFDIKS